MTNPQEFDPTEVLYKELKKSGLDFFVSVPCKLLGDLIDQLREDDSISYTPVSREEEGIGILAGAYLSGKKPAIVMQNSGFGNSVNAICSLLNYYQIPVVFIISHRGSPGEPIEAQKVMGNAIYKLMEAVDVDILEVKEASGVANIPKCIEKAHASSRSLGILLPFSYWGNGQ